MVLHFPSDASKLYFHQRIFQDISLISISLIIGNDNKIFIIRIPQNFNFAWKLSQCETKTECLVFVFLFFYTLHVFTSSRLTPPRLHVLTPHASHETWRREFYGKRCSVLTACTILASRVKTWGVRPVRTVFRKIHFLQSLHGWRDMENQHNT